MASSGHFDSFQTYDGQKAVELLDEPCTESLMKGKQCFHNFNPRSSNYHYCFVGKEQYKSPGVPLSKIKSSLFRKKDGPFGKEFPIFEAPTPDGTSGCSSFTPPSHKSSTSRPLLASQMKQSPITYPRPSPLLTSQQSQPVVSTSRRREAWSHLPLPASQVFQNREIWPIRVTREGPTVVNYGQDAVARLSEELIEIVGR
ncbi:hypothetical protein O181_040905 [Austropuccinia psidii MF-1]|uniref:Uncharacterized protein n=1 Tax=Austropuccinia psidii MF-1 TaxID=1389203 RepID=A0A9Q3HGM6_9BASI|nr:hypothetical protein [Austropuccinia psidii MF-1]